MVERIVTSEQLHERLTTDVPETERSLPIGNRRKSLPYHDLHWKEFEFLTLQLLESRPDIDFARLYGVEGSAQEGIDVYAPLKGQDAYVVVQCKQVEQFGPKKIRDMADLFLGKKSDGSPVTGKDGRLLPPLLDGEGNEYPRWPAETKTFILAISRSLETPQQQRALNEVRKRLRAEGIEFELWDPQALDGHLRNQPDLVDSSFGRFWVSAFCGDAVAASLGELNPRDRALFAELADLRGGMAEVQDRLDGLHQRGVKLETEVEDRLVDRITRNITSVETAAPIAETDPFSKDLEVLRTLVKAGPGAADAAQDKLGELRERLDSVPAAVQAKYYRLVGAFHYNLEHGEAAADAYIRAYDLDPQAEGAAKLMGLAHLLKHDGRVALGYLDQARRLNPEDEEAQAMWVEALHESGREADVEAVERALAPEQLTLGTTLARRHMRLRDWAKMRQVLAVLNAGPHADDPHVRLLNGKLTLHELIEKNKALHGDLRNRNVQRDPEAIAAVAHLDAAVAALDRGDVLLALRTEALNARQVLRCLLGEERLSLEDGRAALRLNPTLTGVQFDLALAHLRLGDERGALQVLEHYGTAILKEVPTSGVIFAAAARRSGDPQKALEILNASPVGEDEDQRLDALNERVLTLLALHRPDEARAVMDAEPSRKPMWHVTSAEIATATGNDAQAGESYRAAVEAAGGFEAATYRFQYAQFLQSRGESREAATVLLPLTWPDLPNGWLETAVKLLYEGHQFVAAQHALEERKRRGEPERMTTFVIDAQLSAMEGDLRAAIPKFEAALARWPDEPFALLHAAAAHARLGNTGRVRALLHRMQGVTDVPYWLLLKASQIAKEFGLRDEAQTLGYQALRAGYGDEETHVHFFNVMHAFPDRQELKVVRPETAVELERETGDKFWAVLTADPGPEVTRNEHALSSPLALALLGKPKGARVTVPTGESYRVLRVVSKYVNAERVWLQEGRELFPVSRRMRMMRAGDLEVVPAGVWETLKAMHEENQELQRLVDEHSYPVTFLNMRKQQAEVTVWDWWLEQGVVNEAYSGDPFELEAAAEATCARGVIVHSSALSVLHHTHLLKLLARGRTLYVTRQTLDDLNRAMRRAVEEEQYAPLRSMAHDGERIVITEESKEVLQARRKRLQALQVLVRARTKIIPVVGLASFLEEHEWLDETLPSTSTFLAAQQRSLPVLCDDLNLLRLARVGLFGQRVQGCTTLTYFDQWQVQGGLSDKEGRTAMLRLATARQQILPRLSDALVAAVFERSELRQDAAMETIIRTIGFPAAPLNEVARNTAILVRQGFLHMPIPERREGWMRHVLDRVKGERDHFHFVDQVGRAIREALFYAPLLANGALDILERWGRDEWRKSGGRDLLDGA